VGVQGAGKSTWARANVDRLSAVVVGSDDVRNELEAHGIDATDKGDLVFQIVEERLGQLVMAGKGVIVDATHARRTWREKEIAKARAAGARVIAVWFDVPLAVCLARNARKPGGQRWGDRTVPERVLLSVARDFERPTLDEFDEVWRISANGRVAEQREA
jgi:predicted kinase